MSKGRNAAETFQHQLQENRKRINVKAISVTAMKYQGINSEARRRTEGEKSIVSAG